MEFTNTCDGDEGTWGGYGTEAEILEPQEKMTATPFLGPEHGEQDRLDREPAIVKVSTRNGPASLLGVCTGLGVCAVLGGSLTCH